MIKKPTLLRIATQGDPVLQQVACRVSDIKSGDFQDLIDNMMATCRETGAQGLAAPQVYRSIELMVIAPMAYPRVPKIEPFAVINPQVTTLSKNTSIGWEGCLSIRGIRAQVFRAKWVDLIYKDRDGRTVQTRLKGLTARIFQHELDHFHGKSFLERAMPRSIMVEEEFLKMMKRRKKT